MGKIVTEIEIDVSGGQIIMAHVTSDGKCKLVAEFEDFAKERSMLINEFIKVPASKLSLKDKFLKYQPKTKKERDFKEQVEAAIRRGLKDFYCPMYAPSFNEAGNGICYAPGRKPAVGKNYEWWEKVAKELVPQRKSRLGTKTEYSVFLAVIIKLLVASGWKVEDAWNEVCNDSKRLGHYWNSPNAKRVFENTGSRHVCGFYDLGNIYKILADEDEKNVMWLGGGFYACNSSSYPLASLCFANNRYMEHHCGAGWVIYEAS